MRGAWLFAAAIALPFAGISLASGCSSSRGAPSPASDASDDVTMADVGAPDDAGPDINQPSNIYPADHQAIPQINYNNGPILQNPRLVTITFVGDIHRDGFRSLVHNITTTDWWMETAEGYCIPDGGPCVGAGTVNAPDGEAWLREGGTADAGDGYLDVEMPYDFPSNTVDDSLIAPWLGTHIKNGDLPQPDSQTVYVIFFPGTTTVTIQNSTTCLNGSPAAYHSAGMANGQEVPYAVLPYCDFGQGDALNYTEAQVFASHEIVESTTDPFPETGFYLETNDAWEGAQSLGGGECGDMCEGISNPNWPDDGYTFQRIWSNQAAAASMQPCQPSPSPNPYFGAALRAPPIYVNEHMSAGYIVARRGKDTVGIADVFSQAPLGHPFLLSAGTNNGTATLGIPDDNITITLSKQEVQNGDGVYVTFSVPSTAVPGYFRVVLRSVYTDPTTGTDYNDWPVIVDVE